MPSDSTVFVDTNVLLYSEDQADPLKHRVARDWLRALWVSRRGRLSTQVLNEFYVNATRKLRPAMAPGDARAEVRRYQRWQPWVVDQLTVETAWAVESRCGLSYWDALMVGAALQQGCSLLLTEDLQHGQQIDGVRIVNPFIDGPDILNATTATPA
jgi:predicted nucleic acid-binding protein